MNATVEQIEAIQGSAIVLLYRVAKVDGTLIQQQDVESIVVHSQDLTNDEGVADQEYTPEDAIFDTLQTDQRWTRDATGYNVALLVPSTLLPEGDRQYQIDAKVNFINGETDQLRPFMVDTQRVYG